MIQRYELQQKHLSGTTQNLIKLLSVFQEQTKDRQNIA